MTTAQTTGSFSSDNNDYHVFSNPSSVSSKLPVGTYNIVFNPKDGFYLTKVEDFKLPSKIYGNNTKYSDTIMNTFLNTRKDKITSAVLSGIRGSGKTLTAKEISVLGYNLGIPTLVLTEAYTGTALMALLTHIKCPFILFIDEFEKVFKGESELNKLLSMLDGVMHAHMLCVMTMNASLNDDRFKYFKNRPGRVYYNIHYPNLSEDVALEYLQENLVNPSGIQSILNFTQRFQDFTLDLLSVLVTEINLNPDVPLMELCNILNIKPDAHINSTFYRTTLIDHDHKPHSLYLAPKIYDFEYSFLSDIFGFLNTMVNVQIYRTDPRFKKFQDSEQYQELQNRQCTIDSVYCSDIEPSSSRLPESFVTYLKSVDITKADDTIGQYIFTFKVNFKDILEGTNKLWTYTVDEKTRTLTLVNTVLDFSIVIEGRKEKSSLECFVL